MFSKASILSPSKSPHGSRCRPELSHQLHPSSQESPRPASAVYLTIQAAPLVHSFTLLPANVQASSILLQCCCLLEKSFHSPAPATRLPSWSPAFEHSSSHLLDSWGALWWTSYATSPGPGSTNITGRATGLWVFGSIFSEKLHLSVYQYNISIFCSGVASGVQCRCALCRVEGGLALVCLRAAAFLWSGTALACLPANAALHIAPPPHAPIF